MTLLLEIGKSALEDGGVIFEPTQSQVALTTKKTPNHPRHVTVIDYQSPLWGRALLGG